MLKIRYLSVSVSGLALMAACAGGPTATNGVTGAEASVQREAEPLSGTLYIENLRGQHITVVDLENETMHDVAVPELGFGDDLTRLVRIDNKLVFRGSMGDRLGAVAVDLQSRHRRLLGEGWYFVASSEPGRVWVGVLDPQSPPTVRALASVYEVDADGNITTENVALPKGRWTNLVGSVSTGLVFQSDGRLEVWNPETRAVVETLEGPFPADIHADQIAWCEHRCPVIHVTDVVAGTDKTVDPPSGYRFEETYHGAFSPDGHRLAVPVRNAEGRRVALVDTKDGSATVIEDSRFGRNYGWHTWSSSGETLFFSTGDNRVMYWSLGSDHARYLAVDFGEQIFSMASS